MPAAGGGRWRRGEGPSACVHCGEAFRTRSGAAQGAAINGAMVLNARRGLTPGGYYSRVRACGLSPVNRHGMTSQLRAELYDRSLVWARVHVEGEDSANARR